MERRSQRSRTLRRQNRQQRPVPPGISGQAGYPPTANVSGHHGYPPPPNVSGQGSDGGLPPHRPPSGSSSKMRVEMVHQPLHPGISGQGYPPPSNVEQGSDGPHRPPSGSSKMRIEMVARIRAERRNIAPEPLTKHHLVENNAEKRHLARENNEVNGENSTSESPKAEEEPNYVSGLIKRLSDKTRFELVRQSKFEKILFKSSQISFLIEVN